MAKQEEEVEEQAPFWVVAYLDLTQQFLAFFILMFSLSTIDVVKLRAILASIHEAFGGGTGKGMPPGEHEPRDLVARIRTHYPGVDTTGTPIRPVAEGDQVMVQRVHEGLKITLEGVAPFNEGSAVLEDSAKGQIVAVMHLVKGADNFLEIRGFTSENPEDSVEGADGKSDQVLLSYQRARAVFDFMLSRKDIPIEPGRLRVTGCGKSSPIVPGTKGYNAGRNRRVEVIVSEEHYKPPSTTQQDH